MSFFSAHMNIEHALCDTSYIKFNFSVLHYWDWRQSTGIGIKDNYTALGKVFFFYSVIQKVFYFFVFIAA